MSSKKNGFFSNDITFKQVLGLVDELVVAKTGKHLSNIEILVLFGTWQGKKYSQIAAENNYTLEYLKNDIGPKLWQILSQVLSEKVTKANVKAVIQQRIYQQEQKELKMKGLAGEDGWLNTEEFHDDTETTSKQKLFLDSQANIQKTQTQSDKSQFKLKHNLPNRDRAGLVGREWEVNKLLDLLSWKNPNARISVEGMGGVGKTALILDVVYRCLEFSQKNITWQDSGESLPDFEAIIFTSGKIQYFTDCGIVPRWRREKNFADILKTIACIVGCEEIFTDNFEESYQQIWKHLSKKRTLLIIDNFENLEEQQKILSFLYELPSTVKTALISREKTPFTAVRLTSLTQTETLVLIQEQANQNGVTLSLDKSLEIYKITGGIPAAINYAIRLFCAGYSIQSISSQLRSYRGDYCRFYLESSMQHIEGQTAYQLLMALAVFVKPPTKQALCVVAAVKEHIAANDLARLQQLSLIVHQQGRYLIQPLTREYVLSKMAANPQLANLVRNRWVSWYLDVTHKHGGKDWREWQNYQDLAAEWDNITEVIQWCIKKERYDDVCKMWRSVKCYTYSQGYRRRNRLKYWDAALGWLEWLTINAQRFEDLETFIEMIAERGWKLTLIGQPSCLAAANKLFTQAWELRQHQTVDWQVNLANHIAVWHIQQKQLQKAEQWLERAESLLDSEEVPSSIAIRLSISISYYKGEIYYKTGNYELSQKLFEQIVDKAQAIGWQRAIFLAKDFLADIAIQEGDLHKAQLLLTEGLQVAKNNQDECTQAYTKRSLASLEQKRGNLKVAYDWAKQAIRAFDKLGMLVERQETQALIQLSS
ncbi:ATP-binding protein [Mastigocoleus sp. MO_188.B34]|uniref:ATP-binding protein n=1 Tax=Mastigocoleus sp. MO_188.B34 TaxID=3036635 RepID=UPI00262FF81B|nr:ATP-binding protein [Mastigocoleus sp. MO_188.B34]MDJ0697408.1 NB-ARC domain-containing protein [Mastigocoleus sp. MO_188.B34]